MPTTPGAGDAPSGRSCGRLLKAMRSSKLASFFGLDLHFRCRSDEFLYRGYLLQRSRILCELGCGAFSALLLGIHFQLPWTSVAGSLPSSSVAIVILSALLIVFAGVDRACGSRLFPQRFWEGAWAVALLVMIVLTGLVGLQAQPQGLSNSDEDDGPVDSLVLLLVIFQTGAILNAPLRCHFTIQLTVVAAGVLAALLTQGLQGATLKAGHMAVDICLAALWGLGTIQVAICQEKQSRIIWMMQNDISTLLNNTNQAWTHEDSTTDGRYVSLPVPTPSKTGSAYAKDLMRPSSLQRNLAGVARRWLRQVKCQYVVPVSHDGRTGSVGKDEEDFLGPDLAGLPFQQILRKADRVLFTKLLTEMLGARVPRRVPVTLITVPPAGRKRFKTEVELVIVFVQNAQPGEPFLVGIATTDENSPPQAPRPLRQPELNIVPVGVAPTVPPAAHEAEADPLPMVDPDSEISFTYSEPSLRDIGQQTSITHGEIGFRCMCCGRPPLPPEDRELLMRQSPRFAGRQRSQKIRSSEFDGFWELQSQFNNIAQNFLHHLTIRGERCVDALGRRWRLRQEGGQTFLLRGKLRLEGGVLLREGKSGILMAFDRGNPQSIRARQNAINGSDNEIDESEDQVSSGIISSVILSQGLSTGASELEHIRAASAIASSTASCQQLDDVSLMERILQTA